MTFQRGQTFFSEYPQEDELFAAIFLEIGATLIFKPSTISFEYLPLFFKAIKRQKYMFHLKKNIHYWNPHAKVNDFDIFRGDIQILLIFDP